MKILLPLIVLLSSQLALANCAPQLDSYNQGQTNLKKLLDKYFGHAISNVRVTSEKVEILKHLAWKGAVTTPELVYDWRGRTDANTKFEETESAKILTANKEVDQLLETLRSCVKAQRPACNQDFKDLEKFHASMSETSKEIKTSYEPFLVELKAHARVLEYCVKNNTVVIKPFSVMGEITSFTSKRPERQKLLKTTFENYFNSEDMKDLRDCID